MVVVIFAGIEIFFLYLSNVSVNLNALIYKFYLSTILIGSLFRKAGFWDIDIFGAQGNSSKFYMQRETSFSYVLKLE